MSLREASAKGAVSSLRGSPIANAEGAIHGSN